MPEEMAPPAPELAVDWVLVTAACAGQGRAGQACKSSAYRLSDWRLAGGPASSTAAGRLSQLAGSAPALSPEAEAPVRLKPLAAPSRRRLAGTLKLGGDRGCEV